MNIEQRRFVTAAEKVDVISPWTLEEWLCRSDVVPNQELLMVRANMEAGRCHPFHTHPTREEIITFCPDARSSGLARRIGFSAPVKWC